MNSIHKHSKMLLLASLGAITVLMMGCELGINPIIFDGTPVEATFEVNSLVSTFPPLAYSVNLQDVLSEIDEAVDSIKAYNITLLIDETGGSNPSVTGDITVNGNTLLSMNGTPISAFATERSIFDSKLQALGVNYSSSIVPIINGYLQQDPKPTVTVVTSGSASPVPLHFTIHVKLYSQVFSKP